MKVKIYTLGCKVNQFESQSIIKQLTDNGWLAVDRDNEADVVIVNSCAVTGASEQKAVKLMNRIRRNAPGAVILLTGCMAQSLEQGSSRLSQADIILGNKRRADILPVLEKYFSERKKLYCVENYNKKDDYEDLEVDDFSGRTRAFLKIEDGCNRFCSYCIIPYARGRVRSCTPEYIEKEIKLFAEKDYKEAVLVGINLSCYGQDNGHSFAEAVGIACRSSDMRIRLGSLEPESMDIDTLRAFAGYENFCPQFHLSLQSGCDATLKRMNRHYTCNEYREIVENIRSVFDNPSVTTDVMVGFAGETEEEFLQSVDFVKNTGFAKVHVFPYSRRPGTAADKAEGHISEEIKKKRAAIMGQAAAESRKRFLMSQTGRIERVLFETRREDGFLEGYTPNYTPVVVRTEKDLVNHITEVRLVSAEDDFCTGELTDNTNIR